MSVKASRCGADHDQRRIIANGPIPRNSVVSISEIPPELLSIMIYFSLPTLDPMEWTHWRDVIDNTASFWTLVSSSLPKEVITTTLSRSAACPLIVHHLPYELPKDKDIISFSREFLALVHPYHSLARPVPRLDTLKLSVTGDVTLRGQNYKFDPCSPILHNVLPTLEHVHLNGLPFQWGDVLGTFGRLKTLILSSIQRYDITSYQLYQAMCRSPALEEVVMLRIDANIESPAGWLPNPITLPRLRTFRVQGNLKFLETILSWVQLPLEVETLVLRFSASLYSNDIARWIRMMSPLLPIIQKLHERGNRSTIDLDTETCCIWTTVSSVRGFKLEIENMRAFYALECIASLADQLHWTQGLPDLTFITENAYIDDVNILAALKPIHALTSIEIFMGLENIHIGQFLKLLSGTSGETTNDSISFPNLRYLKLRKWRSGVDGIIEAMKQRYSTHRLEERRPHQKMVPDYTASRTVWFEDPERPQVVLTMDKIQELRSLDGIERVWLGCLREQPGMLAVVWSEEDSREVRG
ncbi:hypothetical protein FRC04_006018 [Tulasnella sp. 424]|nr:hypothetical protein FRC04_006018 [Tulasnella sp. 424]